MKFRLEIKLVQESCLSSFNCFQAINYTSASVYIVKETKSCYYESLNTFKRILHTCLVFSLEYLYK
jgi:hypothetical protein